MPSGQGLTLCEVQEFSDVTYRLYDYGRPRELHLEKALEVIRRHPGAGRIGPVRVGSGELTHEYLVGYRYFALERIFHHARVLRQRKPFPLRGAHLSGGRRGDCHRNISRAYSREQMWRLPQTLGRYSLVPRRKTNWLKAYVPASLEEFRAQLARAGVPQQEQRRIVIEDL